MIQQILNLKFIVRLPSEIASQYLPLLHKTGVSALSVHKSFDTAGIWEVDCIVFLTCYAFWLKLAVFYGTFIGLFRILRNLMNAL